MQKFRGVTNLHVTVSISVTEVRIFINDTSNLNQAIFDRLDNLAELYDEFENSFSDFISYEDAVNFFVSNIPIQKA